jgi:hypothetical protein
MAEAVGMTNSFRMMKIYKMIHRPSWSTRRASRAEFENIKLFDLTNKVIVIND